MESARTPLYKVFFDQILNEWHLTGEVGAQGLLRFESANFAASHARWAASLQDGGTLEIWDKDGKLFRTEKLAPKHIEAGGGMGMPTG